MKFLIISFALVLILGGVGYFASDYIEKWIPGWKHTIVGLFTTLSGGLAAILMQVHGQEGAIATLLKQDPAITPVISMILGVLILMLGWVTPRAQT